MRGSSKSNALNKAAMRLQPGFSSRYAECFWQWRWLMGAVVALLILCSLAVYLQATADARALAAAKDRWAQRDFDHYRLQLTWRSLVSCHQDYEVEAEQVGVIYADSCVADDSAFRWAPRPMSMSELLHYAETVQREQEGRQCGRGGCACADLKVFHASYDPTLGYLVQTDFRLDPTRGWLSLAYWRYYWASWRLGHPPTCVLRGFVPDELVVDRLKPLR